MDSADNNTSNNNIHDIVSFHVDSHFTTAPSADSHDIKPGYILSSSSELFEQLEKGEAFSQLNGSADSNNSEAEDKSVSIEESAPKMSSNTDNMINIKTTSNSTSIDITTENTVTTTNVPSSATQRDVVVKTFAHQHSLYSEERDKVSEHSRLNMMQESIFCLPLEILKIIVSYDYFFSAILHTKLIAPKHKQKAKMLDVCLDNKYLLACYDYGVIVWDAFTSKIVFEYEEAEKLFRLQTYRFTPSGKLLLQFVNERTFFQWHGSKIGDPDTPKKIKIFDLVRKKCLLSFALFDLIHDMYEDDVWLKLVCSQLHFARDSVAIITFKYTKIETNFDETKESRHEEKEEQHINVKLEHQNRAENAIDVQYELVYQENLTKIVCINRDINMSHIIFAFDHKLIVVDELMAAILVWEIDYVNNDVILPYLAVPHGRSVRIQNYTKVGEKIVFVGSVLDGKGNVAVQHGYLMVFEQGRMVYEAIFDNNNKKNDNNNGSNHEVETISNVLGLSSSPTRVICVSSSIFVFDLALKQVCCVFPNVCGWWRGRPRDGVKCTLLPNEDFACVINEDTFNNVLRVFDSRSGENYVSVILSNNAESMREPIHLANDTQLACRVQDSILIYC